MTFVPDIVMKRNDILAKLSCIIDTLDNKGGWEGFETYKLFVKTKVDQLICIVLSNILISKTQNEHDLRQMQEIASEILQMSVQRKDAGGSSAMIDQILEIEEVVHDICVDFLFRGEISSHSI